MQSSRPQGSQKGTFYYHFQSISELAAAVDVMLGESFDEMLTPARLKLRAPIARVAFGFTQFLEKGSADHVWARLVVQSAQSPTEFGRGVRENLKADLAEAIALGRLTVSEVELAANIVMGIVVERQPSCPADIKVDALHIVLQVMRSMLERGARHDLTNDALEAMLRALGADQPEATSDA